jgi:hypothetical protein
VHSNGKGTAGQAAAGQPAPVPAAPGGFDLSSITSSLTGAGQ